MFLNTPLLKKILKTEKYKKTDSCFIQYVSSNIACSFIRQFKMDDLATVIVLNELMDSDDEKPTRGKTRKWIRRRKERGYFTNIIQELIVEDRHGFREISNPQQNFRPNLP